MSGAADPRPVRKLLNQRIKDHSNAHVLEILARFVFISHDGPTVVGALDQFRISLFLDLFSAATIPRYRDRISTLIVNHIRDIVKDREQPQYVAVPKEGNVLLADAVARKLRTRLIVIRAMTPAIRFGDPVEGPFASGACVVIVDDIASDGELLVRTAGHVRTHGGRVSLCVCAVERKDGNSRERLAEHHVELSVPIELDEQTLRDLARLPNSPNAVGHEQGTS